MLGANVALLSKRERHAVAELLHEHAYLFNNWPPPGAHPCLRRGCLRAGMHATACAKQGTASGGEKPVQNAASFLESAAIYLCEFQVSGLPVAVDHLDFKACCCIQPAEG